MSAVGESTPQLNKQQEVVNELGGASISDWYIRDMYWCLDYVSGHNQAE